MKQRKFISFSDAELNVLENALRTCDEKELLKQLNEERREREYIRKTNEEWLNSRPTIYCC